MIEQIIPMDKNEILSEIEHRQKLLQTYKSNLRKIEERIALHGIDTPISLTNEVIQIKQAISELENDISRLQKAEFGNQETLPNLTQKNSDLLFIPEWSVLKTKVQYVDANLAYKFADASSDTNILFGFTTLFLGAFLSFLVSAFLAKEEFSKTIFWTATAFSFLATLIFAILAKRADNRAKDVKKMLFPESLETDENKAPLGKNAG